MHDLLAGASYYITIIPFLLICSKSIIIDNIIYMMY